MIVHVDVGRRRCEVRDAGDLKRLSVVVAGEAADEEIDRTSAPLARLLSPTHAWVSVRELRAACAREDDADWVREFDAMVAFAASRGWTDGTGTRLRAHVVRGQAPGPQES
ncbi:hypothetical protein [Streptomyces cylindrosporus]|uniref:Uncharacterized protein n=1 Tax=Streptomyces cylindrosporus TaxID=2927583 RepID=A0ABS9Y8B9_9ACTN|nr:hypothetical protein [Streptomyces cylindrosporus]MCI3273465.1 hypothetical protein [Streptomyces cylindrosporus]